VKQSECLYAEKCEQAGVEKSGSATVKKTKKPKQKRPLPDLSGLSKALEELLPEIKSQEEKAATDSGDKYKRATARTKLQQSEQERLAAIFASADFQKDPIGAVGNFLQNTLAKPEPAQLGSTAASDKASTQSSRKKKKRRVER
jgi:hypothetical protein